MRITEIWRYPVKSLQGEQVDAVDVTASGIDGDRAFAIFDVASGLGLTARREPRLLFAAARRRADGGVDITLPDGSPARGDDDLSDWLGRPVVLRSASEPGVRRYENPADFEDEDGAWDQVTGAGGAAFHDSARTQVSIVSATSLGEWDRRRFRSNIVVEGAGEDELVGSTLTLGTARLDVVKRVGRCVMTTRPQPGGLVKDLNVLRTIHRQHDGCLAIGATVAQPGAVRVGDVLAVVATVAAAQPAPV